MMSNRSFLIIAAVLMAMGMLDFNRQSKEGQRGQYS